MEYDELAADTDGEHQVAKTGSLGSSCRRYANTPPKITSRLMVAFTPTKKGLSPPLLSMSAATEVKEFFFISQGTPVLPSAPLNPTPPPDRPQ